MTFDEMCVFLSPCESKSSVMTGAKHGCFRNFIAYMSGDYGNPVPSLSELSGPTKSNLRPRSNAGLGLFSTEFLYIDSLKSSGICTCGGFGRGVRNVSADLSEMGVRRSVQSFGPWLRFGEAHGFDVIHYRKQYLMAE